MSHQSELIATNIDEYLAQHERKELLRFITCGNVDDGKSTLIGRLLFDSKMLYEDTIAAIEKDSKRYGTTGGTFDPALAMDGLKEEREQGITIDVAYRYFSTARRKFIIADTPGHVQYTRNMATGASTADLAVILIDARHGVREQTKRHSFITSLLGIRHLCVAINKMDLVKYSETVYNQIRDAYREFVVRLNVPDLTFIPISALNGDNVVERSAAMPWYDGPTLMGHLETVYIGSDRNLEDFRFPVQYVNRPNLDFRGYCGTIASGIVRQGDEILALPSRKTSRIKTIHTFEGDVEEAISPLSVTLTLTDELDISRGDMIVRPGNVPRLERKFEAMLVWMNESAMSAGRSYLLKHTSRTTRATIQSLRYRVDVNSLHRNDADSLALNEIGRVAIATDEPLAYDDYRRNRGTGSFILIDRLTNATVAAGMIMDRRTGADTHEHWDDEPASTTLQQSASDVTEAERSTRYGQRAATILLTGQSGAGKSTLAHALERRLFDEGRAVVVLDGQTLRLGVSRDLGFSAEDRSENLRRAAETARLLCDNGLICLVAMVAPVAGVRQKARDLIGAERFLTVHLTAPMNVCRDRDPEGRYDREGEAISQSGVAVDYDEPTNADLVLATDQLSVEECVDRLVTLLSSKNVI